MDDHPESNKESKQAILPLTTINGIINKSLDGKVRCSKSFIKMVCVLFLLDCRCKCVVLHSSAN